MVRDGQFGVSLPKVQLRVEFQRAIWTSAETAQFHREQMIQELETALEASLEELGIPGLPIVELVAADPPPVLRVLLGRRYYLPSQELLIAVWQQTTGVNPGSERFTPPFIEWLLWRLAAELTCWFATGLNDLSKGQSAVKFLATITASIVGRHAAELLGREQAGYLLEKALREMEPSQADGLRPLTNLAPARLATMLRPMVQAGISLRDRIQPVLAAISEDIAKKREDAVIAERLISKFRAKPETRIILNGPVYDKFFSTDILRIPVCRT